ncbi:type I restriction endonuclease subunit R [Dactylosporangium sp. NPDC051541]|uniref:type I restriction endonuclease subunit R n=1 Tax=Dactylosporangium sp. NPDC051541 TaxID=3363977 RepID=UPI00378C2C00
MTVRVNTEQAFEEEIVGSLLASGWLAGYQQSYDATLGLDTAHLFAFIGATQMDAWETLIAYAGGDQSVARQHFLRFLAKELDERGALDVLRNGVKDRGVRIRLAYFRPAHTVAEDALGDYRRNVLSVTRQLHFSKATPQQSVDLALFVNGIPVATAELKSSASQSPQNVQHAKDQYRSDRDPKDPFFAQRTLVHFAVDEELVLLTTRLRGDRTMFLPFNQGTAGPGNSGGAGNPPMAADRPAYRTSYLWEKVWQPDAWLDLIKRFLHVEDAKSAKSKGRGSAHRLGVHDRALIFPRYHQWHAVLELTRHAARYGSGNNYLIMHSAGSGKSNTIGWLAHRLSTLHGSVELGMLDPEAVAAERIEANKPVFHKVVVVTDRSVLDKQLQDTIYQFDHTPGVVERITGSGGSKSAEVAAALANTATKIVIVTVQTFKYVLAGVEALKGKRVAVIIDEAHSGYSSDSVGNVGKVVSGKGAEAPNDDADDPVIASAMSRQQRPNVSYFAFTATPKQKTLNKWGVLDPATNEMRAFHIYSMRQAIDEGFILDVLRNYTTYKTYWRVAKEGAEEIEVNPSKAGAQLARLVYLNPATLDAHAEVIVHHFQTRAADRLGGRSKAMVVTRSRESAVRMYKALVKAVDDLDCQDFGILVAFSGELDVDGVKVTEAGLNGMSEREMPDAFAYTQADAAHSRARTEYRFLVVADKYQTGFDQPLLTSMYVEKPLAGVAAVQTLSRLNRTHPLKSQDDLFVLDFANEADDIQAAFRPYFEEARATPSDPNLLYSAQRAVMDHQILLESELREFAEAFLRAQPAPGASEAGQPPARRWDRRHAALYQLTDPARQRFERLAAEDVEAAEMFRADLNDFIRKYGFLSQVMQFVDEDLEALYLFGKHLLNRLPRRKDPAVDIGEIDLTHLRVGKTGEHDMQLTPEGAQLLPGFDESGAGVAKDPDKALLSDLIEEFNQRYGLGLSEADRLKYEERIVAAAEDPDLQQAAVASRNEGDFELPFNSRFRDIMIERAEADTKFTEKFFSDNEFQGRLTREARRAAYRMIRRRHGLSDAA